MRAGGPGLGVVGDTRAEWEIRDHDLGGTLESGQAFGWQAVDGGWEGVVAGRWVKLAQEGSRIRAQAAVPVEDWSWIRNYLALDEDLAAIVATFPPDEPLMKAVGECRGLRLLRQDPWECLASFICSSTKQIVQIREMVRLLRTRYGTLVEVPTGVDGWHAFPRPEQLAGLEERALRDCKLGFRAPYLLKTTREVTEGRLDLDAIRRMELGEARARLMELPGVGRKVADCALLFGFGFREAFPVDVWVRVALKRLYFPSARRLTARRLEQFSATHFGPYGGYAQQYLFHYVRTRLGRSWARGGGEPTRRSVWVR